MCWLQHLSSWPKLMNVKLSGDLASVDKDAAMKFVPGF